MKAKSKKIFYVILLMGGALIVYFLWLSLRSVEIVAVHEDGNHSSVLVKSYPITDKGKIAWWQENKGILKEKYDIPKPKPDGSFTVVFWLFGDGYKEEGKYDRRCFEDMKGPANCIEKEAVFSVSNSTNMGTVFTVEDGRYQLKKNGEIVKLKSEFTAK